MKTEHFHLVSRESFQALTTWLRTLWWVLTFWPDGATRYRCHCHRIHSLVPLLHFVYVIVTSFLEQRWSVFMDENPFLSMLFLTGRLFPQKILYVNLFLHPLRVFFSQDLLISPFFLVLFNLIATFFLVLTQYCSSFKILARLEKGVRSKMGSSQREEAAKKAMMTPSLGRSKTFWHLGLGSGKR